jgi:N,N-dimethylformamidase beta subunit-like protein/copper-binding protein NosD
MVVLPLAIVLLFLLPVAVLLFAQRSYSSSIMCITYDIHNNTINVACDSSLSSIYKVVNDSSVIEKDPNGVWILNAIIKVNPLAKLTIDHTDTSWLKITNKILRENEPNFISISGNAKIDGVKITSWDPMSNQVIRENANGSIPRAHIIVEKGAGRVNVSNSEIAFLGYASNPSNGFLFRYGGDGSNIVNNTFHDMYDGFYSDGAKFITIKDNKYYNNLRYGIDPHTRSHDFSIIGNIAYNNNAIGIICSESCYNILFDSNIAHNNGNAGLMFSLNTNNSTARKNYVYNEKVGISIYGSSNDKVYDNLFKSTYTAVFIAANASNNHIYNNTIADVNNGLDLESNKANNNLFENNHLLDVCHVSNVTDINNNIARYNVIYNSTSNIQLKPSINCQSTNSDIPQSITITNPLTQNQTIFTNFLVINGTTNSLSSSSNSFNSTIKEVDVLVSRFPVNSAINGHYKLAIPISPGNWSRWSFPIFLNGTGSYFVRARATDSAGTQSSSDVTIYFPSHIHDKRIAFIEPTFTYAAYQTGSFYNFYEKYSPLLGKLENGSKIKRDLNLLENRPIPHGLFQYYNDPKTELSIPYRDYFEFLLQHLRKNSPFVTNLTDVDVHEGKIFRNDGSNAYDVLFMFHNEYVTASEYNNLRQFVSSGGTIVFTEANELFAEVSYNKTMDSITLVEGHYWKFDGNSASPGVVERWLNENKEWHGSNFLDVPSNVRVDLANNPFNYTRSEEQYVTNPKAKILIDYHIHNLPSRYKQYKNATVATYQMNYKAGTTIALGFWGHKVMHNKSFLNYLDNMIIPLALGPLVSIKQYIHNVNNGTYVLVPATSLDGAFITYLLPFTINDKFISVCKPPPGSTFPIGETIVSCTATDKVDNKNEAVTSTIKVQSTISH